MAQLQALEKIQHEKLVAQFGEAKGEEYFQDYMYARRVIFDEIAPEIIAIEPALTDHGPKHLDNVLLNAHKLLGDTVANLTGIELYVLCVGILFHDVGNIEGRIGHNSKISKVHEYVRKGAPAIFRREKDIVMRVAEAHCGHTPEGSNDTLKPMPPTMELHGESVRVPEIAALIRLADELAEGPQRTSFFMHCAGRYPRENVIHHKYALSISEIAINRNSKRIALTLDINLTTTDTGNISFDEEVSLDTFLEYSFRRIMKLDEERRFTKHYSDWLSPFKSTSVSFCFWLDGERLDLDLDALIMSDLSVPGSDTRSLSDFDPKYTVDNIVATLGGFAPRGEA